MEKLRGLQRKITNLYDEIQSLRATQEEEEDQGGKEELEREINQLYEDLDQLEMRFARMGEII